MTGVQTCALPISIEAAKLRISRAKEPTVKGVKAKLRILAEEDV